MYLLCVVGVCVLVWFATQSCLCALFVNYCVVLCGQCVLCVAVRAAVHTHVFVCVRLCCIV